MNLADTENSLFVHPMGQSGHLFSPHYADLLALWWRGDYLPMRFGVPPGRTLLLEPLRSP